MEEIKVVITFEYSDKTLKVNIETNDKTELSTYQIIGMMETLKKSLLDDTQTSQT